MTPADNKVKDDSAIEKPPSTELGDKVTVVALVVLLVLIVSAGVMVWKLINSEHVNRMTASLTVPTKTKIVSGKVLEAYILLSRISAKEGCSARPRHQVWLVTLDGLFLTNDPNETVPQKPSVLGKTHFDVALVVLSGCISLFPRGCQN